MSQLQVKFDHSLELSPIEVPLDSPQTGETDERINPMVQRHQTNVTGIMAPLIKVNDILIPSENVLYMKLTGSDIIPTLEVSVNDSNNLFEGFQTVSSDNELRLQILPRFDDVYKKIDMCFYINNTYKEGSSYTFNCTYKVMKLHDFNTKSFGYTTSYDFFESLAHECQLGFATNVSGSSDYRYIYCSNKNYMNLIEDVINTSGESLKSRVMYDCWIDWWNNINFANMYERYNSVDSDQDIMIYVSSQSSHSPNNDAVDEYSYDYVPAIITNSPLNYDHDLHIDSYETINNSSQLIEGSDRIVTTYNMVTGDYNDLLLSDGDQKKDVCLTSRYIGESYQKFDYLSAEGYRQIMKDKMEDEMIEVSLKNMVFGIMRGSKVNLHWYDKNSVLNAKKEGLGVKPNDIKSNIPLPPALGQSESSEGYVPNGQITGQYLVVSTDLYFEHGKWGYVLKLTRPRADKEQYAAEKEE